MRIVGGHYRGRALTPVGQGDAAARLRPTTDRTRETLFNILMHRFEGLDGVRVLDLFAGTGALGLEALSRGAAHATFVENGKAALRLLAQNISLLDVKAYTDTLRIDATKIGQAPAPCALLLADPPYGRGLGVAGIEAALGQGWLAPDALIVLEENAQVAAPFGVEWQDTRAIGNSVLHFGRPAG